MNYFVNAKSVQKTNNLITGYFYVRRRIMEHEIIETYGSTNDLVMHRENILEDQIISKD